MNGINSSECRYILVIGRCQSYGRTTVKSQAKQAAATRQDILAAARRLFAERGYVATSMTAIADEAETAVQTIYDSVGPKRAIMLALVDVQEEEVGVADFVKRLVATQDPREAVGILVEMTRTFMEQTGDVFVALMSAAPIEPDVAAAWEKANRNHRTGAQFVARKLVDLGALRDGVSVERAADVLAGLSWGTTWLQFIQVYGWSFDECEAWLKVTLAELLLRERTAP